MDICSSHDSNNTLSNLQDIALKFLPPNTDSRLQPLNTGIVATIKLCFGCSQMEYAVNKEDINVADI